LHPEIKLFFDQCLSARLPKLVVATYADDCLGGLKAVHLSEWFKRDDDDTVWIPMLARERGWIVITADRGHDPKKEKLPVLCSKYEITHISMTTNFHQAGYLVHKHAVLMLFPQICACLKVPNGTRISLGFGQWHRRDWPRLAIEGKPFDMWCYEKNILTQEDFKFQGTEISN
jgi:hypothetical protein